MKFQSGVVDELSDILPSNNAGNIMYLPFTASLILNLIKSFAYTHSAPKDLFYLEIDLN